MTTNAGLTVDQLLTEIQDRLGVDDFARYPALKMVRTLNEKQRDFAERTRSLKATALIPLRAGVPGYALPGKLALPDGIERAQLYLSSTQYDNLELRSVAYMDDHYPGWRVEPPSTPQILVAGEWQGQIQKLLIYPPPDTAGEIYASGTDSGIRVGGQELAALGDAITGTATGGSTMTLQNTGADFTKMGLAVGQAVVKTNAAVGLEPVGYIQDIAATQLTFVEALTNSGSFGAGDTYKIVRSEFTLIASRGQTSEAYIFSADFASVIPKITIPPYNVAVEFCRYPIDLSYDTSGPNNQSPDIGWSWHTRLADGAAAEILIRDTDRNGRRDQELAKRLLTSYELAIKQANGAATVPFRPRNIQIAVRSKR